MEEYKVLVVTKYFSEDAAGDIEKACNRMAKDEWSLYRVISTGPWPHVEMYHVHLIFRRNV